MSRFEALPSLWGASAIAGAAFALHWFTNGGYGYFRDELNYIACGEHLAWGFVDHPPMIPFLAKLSRVLFGDSLRSIRLVPALASSGLIILTAAIARELGGKPFALVLAGISVLIAPIYLSDGSLLTTNCLEPIFWMGCAFCAIRAIRLDRPQYWLGFGAFMGLGLLEKYSIGVFGFGIAVGLLLTRERRFLKSPWIWAGAVLAFLLFLPNLLWNIQHHWPFLEAMRNIKAEGRDVVLSPVRFIVEQTLLLHFFNTPVWVIGLASLFFARRFAPYRLLAWAFTFALVFFIVEHGKNYYLAPAYPVLFAAGAVVIEDWIEMPGRVRLTPVWLKTAIVVPLLAGGAWLAPLILPILPVDQFVKYMDLLPFDVPRSEVSHRRAILPQHYADQFGWKELADLTGRAWQQIPADERRDCGVFAQNYGQAGAIDFFGPQYGLPPALSGHQTYFLWGPRGYSGNCLLVIDDRKEVLEKEFEQVEYLGSTDVPYALEGHIPVFLCRKPKFGTLDRIWPRLKSWG